MAGGFHLSVSDILLSTHQLLSMIQLIYGTPLHEMQTTIKMKKDYFLIGVWHLLRDFR
jgi:hypothetical protein